MFEFDFGEDRRGRLRIGMVGMGVDEHGGVKQAGHVQSGNGIECCGSA